MNYASDGLGFVNRFFVWDVVAVCPFIKKGKDTVHCLGVVCTLWHYQACQMVVLQCFFSLPVKGNVKLKLVDMIHLHTIAYMYNNSITMFCSVFFPDGKVKV